MIKEAFGVAPTVEAAIEAAKLSLNAPEEADVVTEIIEAPTKRTLGLFGGTPAKVRAYFEESEFAGAEKYLQTVLDLMGVEATVLTVPEDNGVRFVVQSVADEGIVIGRRGETLDALQYLTRLVVTRNTAGYRRISVDVGDYRDQREASLRDMATRTAIKAKKEGHNITLAPMTPYDRRIVHTVVQEFDGANSFSVGDGSDRRVVIAPDEAFRKNDRRPSYNGGRNGFQRDNRGRQNDRGFQRGDRGHQNDRSRDGYQSRNDRPRDGYQNFRNDRPRGGGDFHRPHAAPPQQSDRAPRSDASGGRYGRIEPTRKADDAE
ncbi:MAG: Jag N-terminal domain-containing protein [Oscillospiraceae bacterium]|jgi:spoIIIJ-associated protein|nr:Jag N-terminal domain-containing protein [Oscillospiraceae bacterium]